MTTLRTTAALREHYRSIRARLNPLPPKPAARTAPPPPPPEPAAEELSLERRMALILSLLPKSTLHPIRNLIEVDITVADILGRSDAHPRSIAMTVCAEVAQHCNSEIGPLRWARSRDRVGSAAKIRRTDPVHKRATSAPKNAQATARESTGPTAH
jgi:hypothetical protein